MSNETEIIKVLAPYLAAFPQSRMDRAGLIIYARALKELSTAEIDAAMLHLMRTLRFFPSVAEIFESAAVIRSAALQNDGKPDAGQAWKEAMDCVKKFFVHKEWQYSCPEVKQACKRFGTRELCALQTTEVNTARAQFMRIYKEILETAKVRRDVAGTVNALGTNRVQALIGGLAARKDINRKPKAIEGASRCS